MIKGLHHNAYRCRDSEETRAFYEDFLGLRMVSAFEINEGLALHTFFEMDDRSCLAFFEVPGSPFDFKRQDSLDLHIALGVEPETFDAMLEKAKAEGREVRGPVDHRFVRSISFMPRDVPHAWKNTSSETARALFLYTPAAAGGLLEDLSERRPSDADEHDKLFQRHRWEVVGPNPL